MLHHNLLLVAAMRQLDVISESGILASLHGVSRYANVVLVELVDAGLQGSGARRAGRVAVAAQAIVEFRWVAR